jgi:hypothetical protein
MELQGKIIKILPLRSGVSQSGKAWQSLDAVLETQGQYPRKMVFTVFGEDRIKKFALFEGMECNVQFDIDAHEYQQKWYNSITAYNITNTGVTVQQMTQPQQTVIYPDRPQPQQVQQDDSSELPF